MLELQPITFKEASAFVLKHHRHHAPSVGWKFGIAVNDGAKVVGIIMVGRPVARGNDNGWTLEVTRSCTDGTRNANSMLYGAAARACWALGYKRMITYTLKTEPGTSLRAAGWTTIGEVKGRRWDTPSRRRATVHLGDKLLWEVQPGGVG